MLDDNDHSGLVTFMLGMIVLVMLAVGGSMLLESRFSYSREAVETDEQIEANSATLERMKARRQEVFLNLSETEPVRTARLKERDALLEVLERRGRKLQQLVTSKDALGLSVQSLEEEFAEYRGNYRDAARAAAAGRSLGDLKIRGGREYHQAVISKVTDVGLEIRHEHGLARVQAPDLDDALQDEFQWEDEERRERLAQEGAARRMMAPQPETAGPDASGPLVKTSEKRRSSRPAPAVDRQKTEELREKVRAWTSRVAQLEAERKDASSSAGNGGQVSVPKSLETWKARLARLDAQLDDARVKLAAAKAELASMVPGDSLARP